MSARHTTTTVKKYITGVYRKETANLGCLSKGALRRSQQPSETGGNASLIPSQETARPALAAAIIVPLCYRRLEQIQNIKMCSIDV